MTVTSGLFHSYLGMNFTFHPTSVSVTMEDHINDVINSFESLFETTISSRSPGSPGTSDLFKSQDSPELGTTERESFHTLVAKLLFVAKRVRPDVLSLWPKEYVPTFLRPSVTYRGEFVALRSTTSQSLCDW